MHGLRTTAVAALAVVAVALGGCSEESAVRAADEQPPQFNAGLAGETPAFENALWDDGNAEVAGYDTREARYGTLREGEAVLITVKETFDAVRLVKADAPEPPRHPITVMKLNRLVTVPTGVYTYRQMSSTFLTREDARPVKLAVSSQEWCGTTYKELGVHGDEATLRTFSYFGPEGERAYTVPLGDRTVLADSLPMWLRTLDFEDREDRNIRVVGEQLDNNAKPPEVHDATVSVGKPKSLDVPAGAFEAVPVEVQQKHRTDTYWLRKEAPHTLVKWDRADGGVYRLRWVERAPYWKMNDPEDIGALDPRRRASALPAAKGESAKDSTKDRGATKDPPDRESAKRAAETP